MSEKEQEPLFGAAQPGLAGYAKDLITLWQSELAAMATDREMQEGFQRQLEFWSGWARDMAGQAMRGMPPYDPSGRTAPAAPAGAPAAAAASDARDADGRHAGARDAELARLAARVAELERKLAELSGR